MQIIIAVFEQLYFCACILFSFVVLLNVKVDKILQVECMVFKILLKFK